MEQQREIDWTECIWRAHLQRCDLSAPQIGLLLLLLRRGKVMASDAELRYLKISKRKAAKDIRCSPNTVVEAAQRLREMGLIEILQPDKRGASPIYVLHELRARSLESAEDQIEELELFGGNWSAVVSSGHRPRAVTKEISNLRVTRDRVTDTGPVTTTDHLGSERDWQSQRWWPRPWAREGGMPDDVLVHCITHGDLEPIRHLWREWKVTGDVPKPSTADTVRFLTVVHHCATTKGLRNRMASLVARAKRDPIDLTNVRDASDAWAQRAMESRHRNQVTARSRDLVAT